MDRWESQKLPLCDSDALFMVTNFKKISLNLSVIFAVCDVRSSWVLVTHILAHYWAVQDGGCSHKVRVRPDALF